MMTIDDLITKLETEVFKRKYAPAQHAELVKALERECALADVLAVVRDFVWHHVPGRPIPTPHELRLRCLEEKAFRIKRAEATLRGAADASDVLADVQAQSYNHRVYARAFLLLYRSGRLQNVEAHAEAVRQAIAQIGEPSDDDHFREVGSIRPANARLMHLQKVVNEAVKDLDWDPFA